MTETCKCGRKFTLNDQKDIFRDPGAIICKCGETVIRWHGSRTWYVENAEGIEGDVAGEQLFRYE